MAAKTRRQYAGGAAQTSLVTSITAVATAASIASTTGWPSAVGVPFYVVIDPDTSIEEKCLVTISGSALTMTRGQDGTSAAAHDSGATIYPVFTATDADEANELASKFTAKGDIVTQGASTFTTTTVGTNDQLLKADSSAAGGVAWATYSPTITLGGDLSGSVTLTNLGSATLNATVANNTVALGTDTTGDYVATITGTTNQVSVSGSGSETAAVTLSTPQDIHTGATPTFAGGVFTGSSSGDLLRITQTGTGNALLVEDAANPDSTPFVVDASGRIISGHTSTVAIAGNNPVLQIHTVGAGSAFSRWSATSTGFNFWLAKSRSTTPGSFSVITTGDVLGSITAYGDDGTAFVSSSQINMVSEGTIGTGVIPGRIILSTADSAGTLTERMRIDSAGQVGIGAVQAFTSLNVSKNISGNVNSQAVRIASPVASGVTGEARYISVVPSVDASVGLGNLVGIKVFGATLGAGASITTQYGVWIDSGFTTGGANYGFYGNIASGASRYNLYMNGTADNYLAGRLGVGATLTSGAMAQITNTAAADDVLIIKGAASQTARYLDIKNSAGTSLWHINSSNSIGHGVGTATTTGFIADAGLVAKTSSAFGPQYVLGNKTNDTSAPYLILEKDRADAVVQSNDVLGNLVFRGYDGTNYRSGASIEARVDGTPGTNDMPGRLVFSTTADGASTVTERMRIDSAGQVGIGATPAAGRSFIVGKNLTGAATSFSIVTNPVIQSDVTTEATMFRSAPSTAAASFTVTNLYNYQAFGASIGAGSVVTTQYGYYVGSGLTTATNNYGFYGDIASGTGRYNLYMNGTADNYLAGSLGIGATPAAGRNLLISKAITGSTTSYAVTVNSGIQSDVTSEAHIFRSVPSTAAASFTLTTLTHFATLGINTPGAGSVITTQVGYYVNANLTGATNNYAFQGSVPAAANRFNLYMDGTAANYLAGRLGVGATLTSGAMAQVTNTTAADKALVVKGAASQTGNYFEIQNSAGTSQMSFDSNGLIAGAGTSLGAWTAYTPTWGGNTTNPVIGDGTITGAYCQIGKTVFARVKIVMGSTTTFGSGAYFISMPVTAKTSDQIIGHGFIRDVSASTNYLLLLTPASTTNLWIRYSDTPADVNATTPATWAVNDSIQISFTYEAA